MAGTISLITGLLATSTTDSPTTVLIATFAGYGITGVLAALYIIDLRKERRDDRAAVQNILSQIGPLLAEIRDVMRADVDAHRTSAEASGATSQALERFAQRLPSVDEVARIRVALERMDRR